MPNAQGEIVCPCGRRWHLELFYSQTDGSYIGSSWILEVEELHAQALFTASRRLARLD